MRQRGAGVLAALLVLLFGTSLSGAQEAMPEEQLAQLNSAIAKIESWLDSASNSRSTLETELRASNKAIAATTSAIEDNRSAIAELAAQLLGLGAQRDALEEEKSAQTALIAQAMRASHKSGQEPYLKLLLNQQDPALGARMLHYYAAFNRSRLARIEAFQELLGDLENTEARIARDNAALQARQAELDTQRRSLEQESAKREDLLTALQVEIASRSGELQQLAEDRQRLEALVTQIEEAIANIPAPDQLTPFAQARGQLPWPVEGAALNRFGDTYSDGNLHRQGLVLGATLGAPVRAVHPGRVVFADWLRGSGLLVVVDHGNAYLSLYAHNQDLVKRKGDWVNRGEALATAGSDAGMGRPGIYFEIRHNGQAQDPAQWCVNTQ